jgi:uncharacterized membrane protein
MNKSNHDKEILAENRKFQLERISLFSDAVFAIAITLLIIELKLPEMEDFSADAFLKALNSISYRFFGFLFSFFFIGMYWVIHHKIFYYIKEFNQKLLWLNIFMLLTIVMLPFTTGVAFEFMTFPDYPFMLYAINHILVGISLYCLWDFLGNSKNISVGLENPRFIKFKKARSLTVVLVFSIVIAMGFVSPFWSRISPILIFPFFLLIKKRFKDVIENK